MERCPTCQARLKEASVCPRCKTDLTRLFAIEAQAEAGLRRAVAHWADGDGSKALRAVEASLRLKREPLGLALRGFLFQNAPCPCGSGRTHKHCHADQNPTVD